MVKRKIEIEVYTPDGEWPECFYAGGPYRDEPEKKLCGESSEASIERGWTSLCRCPSCPLKVGLLAALSAEMRRRDSAA